MNKGVFFIICTISSAECDRTESIMGGSKGVVEASWLVGLGRMGKGVSLDGAEWGG